MIKVVINAGGKGTRISSMFSDIPKPMIKIDGMPVLEHEINCLRDQGFKDIIITVSHMGDIIMDYFKDGSAISPVTNKEFGVSIKYYNEIEPLGTAGALFKIKDILDDDFILLNADSIFDIDFKRFVNFHKEKNGLVTLFTHPNSHPYDSGLLITNDNNEVIKWLTKEDERPEYYENRVNAGIHIISPKILEREFDKEKIDLDRDILKPLANTGNIFAYDSPEYVKDMGTPERFTKVEQDYISGIVNQKNLLNKQKAIFIDRDGTINKLVGFLRRKEELELLPDVEKAIKLINSSAYLAIVITNQPVIARGETTVDELREIHKKLETLLGKEGAYLDDIFYCPHHPDSGFPGEVKELKIKCECRKPGTLLVEKACEKYNIDLNKCVVIGDTDTDRKLAENLGIDFYLVDDNNSLYDIVKEIISNE